MDFDNIINSNKRVTEKLKLIEDYKNEMIKEYNNALKRVKEGYKYCSECGEYYKENTFETKYKREIRKCTFHSLAEFDNDTYEDKMCFITYDVCPMGHIINEKITH